MRKEIIKLMPVSENQTIEQLYNAMVEINKTDSKILSSGHIFDNKYLLNPGATEDEIHAIQKMTKYPLPKDYIQFLQLSNGLRLTRDFRICDINSVILWYDALSGTAHKHIMTIGQFLTDVHICLNLKAEPDRCIYVREGIGGTYAYSLECGFTPFLNRITSCYGTCFWLWGVNFNKKTKVTIM